MLPIRLSLKDFCSHSFTEFYFDDFQSALIIGRVRDNDRFSNGSGKSTIFNSIEYVLFNETHFSTLERVIRDGCDVCRVEFDFVASVDKETYRIVRSNSRKTGTDVRLFRKNADNWIDLTQRRVSDTEKEIYKILGFNYKAFCASVLFNQAGSENSSQRDFGNLPALTPEKRKSVLREVLQLNVYNSYEKLAKSKQDVLTAELTKQQVVLSTLGDPDLIISSLVLDRELLDKEIVSYNNKLEIIKLSINNIRSMHGRLLEKVSQSKAILTNLQSKKASYQDQIRKNTVSITDFKNKIGLLPEEAKQIKEQIVELENHLASIPAPISTNEFKTNLSSTTDKLFTIKSEINSLNQKLQELNKPITEEKTCSHCHQVVSDEHKKNWQSKTDSQIASLLSSVASKKAEYDIVLQSKLDLENQISKLENDEKKTIKISNQISILNKDLENKRSLYKNYNSLMEDHIKIIDNNKQELSKIEEELSVLNSEEQSKASKELEDLNLKIKSLTNDEQLLSSKVNTLIGKKAILAHKIEQCETDKSKIADIKKSIQDTERTIFVHSRVVQAFGSGGIPYLITHSVLDELQQETNNWLVKLRPGLQLQFVEGEKDQADKLDLLYFIDGNQREYKQLSGAQKIIVALSIKLSLLFIMNKRLGIDIKFMLLDEVDQALDPGSTEIFADIIKIIQEELKVMVITHDEDLKHKFSYAVCVDQDENNVSKGKLIHW